MAKERNLVVRGAREHNLKNINVVLPRNKLIVITGLSGSGKSSLAFDTIYAEGQRRYVESLSAYARQFLGQMEKPDVDRIEGLSPAIADTYARSLYQLGYVTEAAYHQRQAVIIKRMVIDRKSNDEENKADEKELEADRNELRDLQTTLKYYEQVAQLRSTFKPLEPRQ